MKLVSAKNLAVPAVNEAGDGASMFEVGARPGFGWRITAALKTLPFDEWRGTGVDGFARATSHADRGQIEACTGLHSKIVRVNLPDAGAYYGGRRSAPPRRHNLEAPFTWTKCSSI